MTSKSTFDIPNVKTIILNENTSAAIEKCPNGGWQIELQNAPDGIIPVNCNRAEAEVIAQEIKGAVPNRAFLLRRNLSKIIPPIRAYSPTDAV